MSNCDLKIITAANVPENYKEEGHMREHWQNLSKYLTTLKHAQENQARARAKCKCNCRCDRKPGRLVTCDWCGQRVGPKCCLAHEDPIRVFCHWCKPGLVNGLWLVYSHCVDCYACKQWCGGKKTTAYSILKGVWFGVEPEPRTLGGAQHTNADNTHTQIT